jgi:hypothetical protein
MIETMLFMLKKMVISILISSSILKSVPEPTVGRPVAANRGARLPALVSLGTQLYP